MPPKVGTHVKDCTYVSPDDSSNAKRISAMMFVRILRVSYLDVIKVNLPFAVVNYTVCVLRW